jgi:hypothetical protein
MVRRIIFKGVMQPFVMRIAVLVIAFAGIAAVRSFVGAACNNDCRHRQSHCFMDGEEKLCKYWATPTCYNCVGLADECEDRNDKLAHPCAALIGQTNSYEEYDECTDICMDAVGYREGKCSGFLLKTVTGASLSRCKQ